MKEPEIRVLVVFGGTHLFGHELANIEVFRSLKERGVASRFIVWKGRADEHIVPHLERLGLDWTYAPFGHYWGKYLFGKQCLYLFRNLWGLFATSRVVKREIANWKPTHVFGGNWLNLHYAIFALRSMKPPLVFRAGDDYPYQHRKFLRKLVADPVRRRVAQLVCNCSYLAKRFSELNMSRPPVVIYNHPARRQIRAESSADLIKKAIPVEGQLKLIFIGQMTESKGAIVLIEALKQLQKHRPELCLSLTMVGDFPWGSVRSEIESMLKSEGLANDVEILGYREDVDALLAEAHLHICPSLWQEPSPNVVFEAKRAGLPSIVFPVGGVPELVSHKIDGFVCGAPTAESLSEGIDYFAANRSQLIEAGHAARKNLTDRFGEERFQNQWLEVFRGLVSQT